MDLTAAIDMLRSRGVKSYNDFPGGGFSLEFFPAPVEMTPERAKLGGGKCLCGHEHHEHNMEAGLCLRGCDPSACAGPEKGA